MIQSITGIEEVFVTVVDTLKDNITQHTKNITFLQVGYGNLVSCLEV